MATDDDDDGDNDDANDDDINDDDDDDGPRVLALFSRATIRRTLRSMLCNFAGSMLCSIAQGGRGDLCMGSPWYWLLSSSKRCCREPCQ